MSIEFTVMAFGKYDAPKSIKLPTFLQFLKSKPKSFKPKASYPVDFVWLPGEYDNVTLQTDEFRYICNSEHPLYSDIIGYFDNNVLGDECSQVVVTIDSVKDKTIEVSLNTKKSGAWRKVGDSGRRFEVF